MACYDSGSHKPLTMEDRFDPRPVHVKFVVDKVAVGQVFLSTSVVPTISYL
jgi:hypothetical protein